MMIATKLMTLFGVLLLFTFVTPSASFFVTSPSPFLHRTRTVGMLVRMSPKNKNSKMKGGGGEGGQSRTNLKLKTYDDYKDKLQALSFLIHYHNSNISKNDTRNSNREQQEICRDAQAVFDKMYNEWYMNDNDSLEPTTEIYNLLIDIYSNTNTANSNTRDKKNKNKTKDGTSNTMEIPQQILDKMEQSFQSIVGVDNDGDGGDSGENVSNTDIPLPNEETYMLMVKGYSNGYNSNNMLMVEQMLDRFEQRCEEELKMKFRRQQREGQLKNDNDEGGDIDEILIQPTTEIYNTVLSAWLKSGYRCSAKKAEDILYKLMDNGMVVTKTSASSGGNTSSTATATAKVKPNTKTFYLVMSCFVRDTTLSRAQKEQKINQLVEFMKEYQNANASTNVDIDIDPNHHRIKNLQIKVSKTPMDAELLLFQMIDTYQKNGVIDHRPNAASFISTILLWKDSISTSNKRRVNQNQTPSSSSLPIEDASANATERSVQLLDLLTEMYKLERDTGKNVDDLKPDVRVYNAVQSVYMRSTVKNKARETKKLLLKLISLCHQKDGRGGNGDNEDDAADSAIDEDYIPGIRQWNNVLNACVYTTGNQMEKKEAMKILVETFNEMRGAAPTQAGAGGTIKDKHNKKIVVEPNHITYGMFLKGCANLLPPTDKQKQQAIVEKIFRKCCREGYMSEFVFTTFVDTASPELCRQILGGDVRDGIKIPAEWTRNVR